MNNMQATLPDYLHPYWVRYQTLYQHARLPKTMLLVHPNGEEYQLFSSLILGRLLCEQEVGPCGECKHCRLFQTQAHPDLHHIQLETGAETIKVDTVRALQASFYLPPQVAKRRVIYLQHLAHFTPSALNALLKILEEPAEPVYFVGSTPHLDGLLPTILSRFQRWLLPSPASPVSSYLDKGRWIGKSDAYLDLLQQSAQIHTLFDQCMSGTLSVVALAEKWSAYPLKDLFHVLYCLVAEEVKKKSACPDSQETWQHHVILRKIEAFMLQLQQCPSANPLLILETWLLELVCIVQSRSKNDGKNHLYIRE